MTIHKTGDERTWRATPYPGVEICGLRRNEFGGGAILDVGSTLILSGDIFSNNQVRFKGGPNAWPASDGGAINSRHGASLVVSDCVFTGNAGPHRRAGMDEVVERQALLGRQHPGQAMPQHGVDLELAAPCQHDPQAGDIGDRGQAGGQRRPDPLQRAHER